MCSLAMSEVLRRLDQSGDDVSDLEAGEDTSLGLVLTSMKEGFASVRFCAEPRVRAPPRALVRFCAAPASARRGARFCAARRPLLRRNRASGRRFCARVRFCAALASARPIDSAQKRTISAHRRSSDSPPPLWGIHFTALGDFIPSALNYRDLDDVLLNNVLVLDECMNMNRNLLLLFDGAVDLRSFKLGGVWRLTDLTNDVSASIVRRPRAFCTAGLESRLSISPIRLPSILVE